MGSKNLHDKPFDEGTLKKLEIFELYTKEWLPTFIMSKAEGIDIFDFFAGTGFDINNVPGSPIRILRQIKGQIGNIFHQGTKIFLILNVINLSMDIKYSVEVIQRNKNMIIKRQRTIKKRK